MQLDHPEFWMLGSDKTIEMVIWRRRNHPSPRDRDDRYPIDRAFLGPRDVFDWARPIDHAHPDVSFQGPIISDSDHGEQVRSGHEPSFLAASNACPCCLEGYATRYNLQLDEHPKRQKKKSVGNIMFLWLTARNNWQQPWNAVQIIRSIINETAYKLVRTLLLYRHTGEYHAVHLGTNCDIWYIIYYISPMICHVV